MTVTPIDLFASALQLDVPSTIMAVTLPRGSRLEPAKKGGR